MLRFISRTRVRTFALTFFGIGLLGTLQQAHAGTPPPGDNSMLLGVFQGHVQGSDFSCPNPGDNDNFDISITITLDQANSHASGGFITGDGDQGDIKLELFATNSVNGQVVGKSTDGTTFNLSLFGNYLNGNTLDLNFSGSASDGCSISGFLEVTRVTNPGIDPANAPPSVVLNGQGASDAGRFGTTIAGIARQRRTGNGSGALPMQNGFMIQGKAAGSGMPLGAWAGYSRTVTDNDFTATSFKDHRNDFLLGIDTSLNENLLVGVAFGLQFGETKTHFNLGEQNLTAITVAPYVGMLLTDWLSLDGTVGYSDVSIRQFRTAAGTGARINSDVDGERYFVSANLSATHSIGDLLLTGTGGVNWATQHDDSFTESGGLQVASRRSTVGRFQLGGEAAYTAGAWEPYARATFEYDFTRTQQNFAVGVTAPENDDTDVLAGVGLRYYGDNGVSGSVEYTTLLGRSNLNERTFSGNVRWEF